MTQQEAKKPSGLAIRVLSGVVLAPLTIALLVMGGWFFMVLMGAAILVALYEWHGMTRARDAGAYLTLLFGALYLTFSFGAYTFLRFGFDQGAWLAICLMVVVWASDIGAYFVGRAVGGPKLAPVLSPRKTWAGFGGALFFAGLALALLAMLGVHLNPYIPTDLGLTSSHVWGLFVLGAFFGAVGQAGDLLVSFFKRRAALKDTGHLIPGHGGLLDRIDSALLVSPIFLAVVILWLG